MRVVLFVIILICAIDAFSSEPTLDDSTDTQATEKPKISKPVKKKTAVIRSRGILGAGLGLVGEKANDNRSYEFRTLFAARGGVEFGQHEFLLELGGFKQQTGSSGVTIDRFHQQIDLWYHYLFFPRLPFGHPYIGAGIGAQRDEVTTTLFGTTSKDVGAFETQLSVGAGYRFELGTILTVWLEGRLATSSNYEPSVLPSGLAAIGFRL